MDKAQSLRLQLCLGFENSFSAGKSDVLSAKQLKNVGYQPEKKVLSIVGIQKALML